MDDRTMERNDEVEIDLQRLIFAVVQRVRQVIAAGVLCAVIALLGSIILVKPQAQATVLFYVNNNDRSAERVTHSITSADIMASKNLVDSYIVILNTEATLTEVIEYAGAERTVGELQEMIEAEAVNGTEIFQVVIAAEESREAERIADAIAYVLPTRISEIIEGTSAKVVDMVVTDAKPAAFDYCKNTALGLLFGVLLSAALIVLRELFDSAIKCEEDIAKTTRYPVFVAVSQKDSFEAAEAYKLLRTKLLYTASKGRDCRVIGVTAPTDGEGATTTAIGLARALSLLDRRVVLVDCDLRRSALADTLHVDERGGLADYLSCRCGPEDLLHTCTMFGEESAFTVIPAGQTMPNSPELLSSPRMEALLTILRNTYDDVILDLPPVGRVSDAMIVAKEADGMLLVVRRDYSNRHGLKEAIARLESVDADILGIVLNGVSEKQKHTKSKARTSAEQKKDFCCN